MDRTRSQFVRFFAFLVLCAVLEAAKTTNTLTTGTCKSDLTLPANGKSQQLLQLPPVFFTNERKGIVVRGGSDSESDGYDEEEEDDAVSSNEVLDQAIALSKKSIILIGKIAKNATIQAYKALQRAIRAGLETESDEEEQGLFTRVINALTRMIKAAVAVEDHGEVEVPDADDKDDEYVENDSEDEVLPSPSSRKADFGSFLSSSYGIIDGRDEEGHQFLGGTLASAMEIARSQARMLVVFLPSKRPSKGKKSKDQLAIESLLTSTVSEAANRRARKKGGESGSFLFWGAKAGSSESTAAIKRLKTKGTSQKGEKIPVLAVVYPALTRTAGGAKHIPKVLAQHHCSPPPTEALMASWLDSLRKRHAKQYSTMRTDLKEAELYQERQEGYSESVKNDKERKQREKEEEANRLGEAEVEKERLAAVAKRREELRESLPEEDKSKDAKKIALRFGDGRSGLRQFSPNQPMSDLFNWVDAMYEIERENVVLTTMNGKQSFTWEGEGNTKSLMDSGLGKNTGFRVTETKQEPDEKNEEDSDE